MAFPENQVYVRWEFGWQLGSTDVEIQDFGMWGTVRQEGLAVFQPWQAIVDAIAKQSVAAWKSNFLVSQFAGKLIARRVVAYHYDQPHLEVLHRGESGFVDAQSWLGSGDAMPPQTTVAISTFGYDPAGYASESRSKRGRYYLPTPSRSVVDDDGELKTANQSSLLTNCQSFHNDLSDVLDLGDFPLLDATHWIPAVVSPTRSYSNDIAAIRVGRIFDTQRRRRNKLAESYVVGPVNG